MNDLVKAGNFGALSSVFAGAPKEDDLSAGIAGGYGIITFKGKVWKLRHKDQELELMREDGDGARGSIELVLVKGSNHVAKTWYEAGYTEGSTSAPDCFSNNGVTPDPSSPKKQNAVCATCPRNAYGSALKQDGTPGKGKACGDFKRVAATALGDISNEMWGGAMLLRIPASSLNNLAAYGKGVQKLGHHYYSVGTRVAFDPKEAYPKLVFTPIRPLTDEEARLVQEMQNDPQIDRILAEDVFTATPVEHAEPAMSFEQDKPKAVTQQAAATQARAEATKVGEAAVAEAAKAFDQAARSQTDALRAQVKARRAPKAAAPQEEVVVEDPKPAPAKAGGFGAPAAKVEAAPKAAPKAEPAPQAEAVLESLDDELARLMDE